MLKRCLFLLVAVLAISAHCAGAEKLEAQLVYDRGFPDPHVFKEGKYFWIVGSGSRILRTSTFSPEDIKVFIMEVDYGKDKDLIEGTWAKRIYKHTDGTYHMYGSVHYTAFRTLLGHFSPAEGEQWTDEKPITKWKLDKIILGDLKLGQFMYDATVLRDEAGEIWVLYASGNPNEVLGVDIHVKARKMRDPLTIDESVPVRAVLSPQGLKSEDRNPNFVQILEGPLPVKVGDWWALSYSAGDFSASNYKTGFAYSKELIPQTGTQYQKPMQIDKDALWKNDAGTSEVVYTLQSEVADWPNYISNVTGPGHGNLVEIKGKHYLVFHGRKPGATDGQETEDMAIYQDNRRLWKVPVKVQVGRTDLPLKEWIVPEATKN